MTMQRPCLYRTILLAIAIVHHGSMCAQVNIRFDSYSQYELPERSEKNTLMLSSSKDSIITITPLLSDVENLVISNIEIDKVVLEKLGGMNVANLELYSVHGNVDSLISAFLIMPRARALKIYSTDIGSAFAKIAVAFYKKT